MAWNVSFEPRALKEIAKLDREAQRRIARFLRERVEGGADPRQWGKSLTGDKMSLWRYRIGPYRVVCSVDDSRHTVLILRVAHRKQVYR